MKHVLDENPVIIMGTPRSGFLPLIYIHQFKYNGFDRDALIGWREMEVGR